MQSPFFFSSDDTWRSAAQRGRSTQRPLFFVADPWSASDCYPGRTNQFPELAPTRTNQFPEWAPPTRTNQFPEWAPTRAPVPVPAATPRVVSIPVHFGRSPPAAAKPIGPIRSPETSKSGAAIAIQRVFRGHLVRKDIKLLSQIAFEVGEIEGRIHANEARLRVDPKERLQMNEMLMAQLLRLDSVRWVREYRRKVIRKVIALQEFLDGISVQFVESPNSVNSQATAEMKSNYVDSSDVSNDVVSKTISHDAICAVSEDVSQKSKDPILDTIEEGEDAEKKSDANVSSDEEFNTQDSLACRNDSEEHERMSEDEGFVVVAAEEATCNSPVDVHSQKDPRLEFTEQETCKVEAMEEVVQLPKDSAQMTVEIGNGSMEVSGVEEALKKVMAESERLQGLVAALCERNAEQCRLMVGLVDRVGNLELAVQRMEKKNKKKRAKCSPVGKKGR